MISMVTYDKPKISHKKQQVTSVKNCSHRKKWKLLPSQNSTRLARTHTIIKYDTTKAMNSCYKPIQDKESMHKKIN